MKRIYIPKNEIEGNILKAYLESDGIRTDISGESLRGGIGEVPVSDFIGIWVDDAEEARAVKIIQDYQSSLGAKDQPVENPKRKVIGFFWVFGLGAGVGLILGLLLNLPGNEGAKSPIESADLNKDGKPDVFYRYQGGQLSRIEKDRDLDGKIDSVEFYEGGKLTRIEADNDYSGVFSKFWYYGDGGLERSIEYYMIGEKPVEETSLIIHDDLRAVIYKDTKTGIIFKSNHYSNNHLRESHLDLAETGRFTRARAFDRMEEPSGESKR
ncbi:MAG: DUF2007 domain-containing protein [Spirochaetes bacterium]|nr:DUF2007 domain-containing protein [Spirochaetota bacterium]